jgi:hypothetical protein
VRMHDSLRRAVEDLVGMGVSDDVWCQATLPMRHGGLGIRDPLQTQPAARLAALAGLHLYGWDRVGIPEIAFSKDSPDLASTIEALRNQLGPNFEPLAEWSTDPRQFASAFCILHD